MRRAAPRKLPRHREPFEKHNALMRIASARNWRMRSCRASGDRGLGERARAAAEIEAGCDFARGGRRDGPLSLALSLRAARAAGVDVPVVLREDLAGRQRARSVAQEGAGAPTAVSP